MAGDGMSTAVWRCGVGHAEITVFAGASCDECGRSRSQSADDYLIEGRLDEVLATRSSYVRGPEGCSDHRVPLVESECPICADDALFVAYERRQAPAEEQTEPTFLERLREALVDSAGLDSIPDPEPLIGEDILFKDCLVWMVGKPGCMKSFTALDMAGCVGTGESWQGYQVARGPVLYLVAEGVRGTKKRVRAWEKAMGTGMTGVHFLPVAVQSKNAEQWRALIQLCRELKPALIVLDTQARITVGVEENSNTEMGEFVDQAERLRKASGACVVIVHHIGRNGDTGRGATTLDGAMSTIVKVTKNEDQVTLECQKNKDGAEWDDITLRAVPMGDSIVLMPDDGTHRPTSALASRKWIQEWWRLHELEPVSVSVLVKSGVTTEPTFHRSKLDLIHEGVVIREGVGNGTRYRLTADPTLR